MISISYYYTFIASDPTLERRHCLREFQGPGRRPLQVHPWNRATYVPGFLNMFLTCLSLSHLLSLFFYLILREPSQGLLRPSLLLLLLLLFLPWREKRTIFLFPICTHYLKMFACGFCFAFIPLLKLLILLI